MPFVCQDGNIYKTNKVGAKIASYKKLAIIVHAKTFEVIKYGELDEMKKLLDEKYYNHPQWQHRTYQYMIYYSEDWLAEALNKMIEEGDTKFTSQLDYVSTEHLFITGKHVGMVYHGFTIAGDPDERYWKEQEKRWQEVQDKSLTVEDEAAEKRRQRSLKAAETMRKKREQEAKKEDEDQTANI